MRFSTFSLVAAFACSALSAAVPVVAKTPALPEEGAYHLSPRGVQYNIDTFDDLQEEASSATQDQITASVNYLANFWSANGATWALTGGIAMQKYGMRGRDTRDSDIAVSILPLAITNAAAADPNIQYPPTLMAASGTVTLFVNINGQQVQNDVFPTGKYKSPSPNALGPCTANTLAGSELALGSLDNTVTIDGWPIVSILSLIKSKVQRAAEKDITDVAWFCRNRLSDVTAIASQIDYQRRLSFASDAKASDSADVDVIIQGLGLDPAEVPSK